MSPAKGKVVKKGTDAKGRPRKFIEIRGLDYNNFEFGDIVEINKVQSNAESHS